MKKIMALILMVGVLVCSACVGTPTEVEAKDTSTMPTFSVSPRDIHDGFNLWVATDNETGVEYIICSGVNKIGIIPRIQDKEVVEK